MIRVNLLEGTTEQRVAMQKTKVAARRGQQIFMAAAALLMLGIAWAVDHFYTTSALADANSQLAREKEEAAKLKKDTDRKRELDEQLRQLEERIKVIKQLRAEQKGPVAMLSAINERLPAGTTDFQLHSVVQKGNHLQITGSAPNQQTLADFFRQLEFSNGLFTNLVLSSIEGRDVKVAEVTDKKPSEADEMTRLFRFTIDCAYNKPRDPAADDDKPAD
ncbi:MAG TPA: PilN domain-containing protein, partial [Blastocatellia bacterium]|nr:PilN domain-containing protein [Blastocatellia bacterium]